MKRYQIILIAIFLAAALGVIGNLEAKEEELQHDQYCYMVKLWKETRGQDGWPAYNGDWMCK